jgi:hypothetical protein
VSERLPRTTAPPPGRPAKPRPAAPSLFGEDLAAPEATAYPQAKSAEIRKGDPDPAVRTEAAEYSGAPRDIPKAGPELPKRSQNIPAIIPANIPGPDPSPDRAALRPVVAELAARVVAESERRWEAAGRRALEQLRLATAADADADAEHAARVVTARAILEGAVGDAPAA